MYEFKQRYPDADIEPFLSRSSDFFKNYIERGLKYIEEKKRKEMSQNQTTPDNNNPVFETPIEAAPPSEGGVNPDAYRERLKKLRALAGLESGQVRLVNNVKSLYSLLKKYMQIRFPDHTLSRRSLSLVTHRPRTALSLR